MLELINFTGKRILIIGASSGIGKETAKKLSDLDAEIILVARREDKLKETVSLLKGSGHAYYSADMSKLDEIEQLFRQIKTNHGRLDGLVYSAGMNSAMPLLQLNPNKLRGTFDINFFAFVEAVRQATKKGRFNAGMRIVAVSSNAAIRGDKAHTAYSASKAAMNSAIRCMAKELADKDICINAVAPAITNTEIYRQYHLNSEYGGNNEDRLMERQYLGLIEPGDVADAISFLLSSAARKITGITMPVDAGLSSN